MPVTIKVDGIDYLEQAPEVLKHIEKLDASLAAAVKADADKNVKIDAQAAEISALKEKLVKADAEIAAMPAKIASAAKARSELVAVATPHLDASDVEKIDTLTEDQIKSAVAVKAFPNSKEKIDKCDAAGIQVWYEAALSSLDNTRIDAAAAANREAVNGRQDAKKEKGKEEMTKEDCDKAVTQRYKNTNRDALLK